MAPVINSSQVGEPPVDAPGFRVEVTDAVDGIRWRLVADNHEVVGHGGQGYSRRIDTLDTLGLVLGGEFDGETNTIVRGRVRHGVELDTAQPTDRAVTVQLERIPVVFVARDTGKAAAPEVVVVTPTITENRLDPGGRFVAEPGPEVVQLRGDDRPRTQP